MKKWSIVEEKTLRGTKYAVRWTEKTWWGGEYGGFLSALAHGLLDCSETWPTYAWWGTKKEAQKLLKIARQKWK